MQKNPNLVSNQKSIKGIKLVVKLYLVEANPNWTPGCATLKFNLFIKYLQTHDMSAPVV